ncbi:MAG: hypothetical protein V1749_08940, partial [Candidatus Desantisbacteria bacterium]
MLHKKMIFALGIMGMICFLGKGAFGEGTEITLFKTLEGHGYSVHSVAFSPDGRYLASGSCDNTIKLWEMPSGNLLKTLEGHGNYVNSVAFSPDGRYLASGSWDNTIKLWEMPSGNLLKTLEGHSNSVISVAFSPDGRYLASGSRDKTIKLWEMSISPPFLSVQAKFDDTVTGANGLLDSAEEANLILNISNTGEGGAFGIGIYPSVDNSSVTIPDVIRIGTILSNQSKEIRIPISASTDAQNGAVTITIATKEINGNDAQTVRFTIPVHRVEMPVLEIAETGKVIINDKPPVIKAATAEIKQKLESLVQIKGNGNGIIENEEVVEITVPVKNIGQGDAYGVKLSLLEVVPKEDVSIKKIDLKEHLILKMINNFSDNSWDVEKLWTQGINDYADFKIVNGIPCFGKLFGKEEVIGIHPVDCNKPAILKVSTSKKSVKLFIHSHPSGDSNIVILSGGKELLRRTFGQNTWEEININLPDDANSFIIENYATSWRFEFQYLKFDGNIKIEDENKALPAAPVIKLISKTEVILGNIKPGETKEGKFIISVDRKGLDVKNLSLMIEAKDLRKTIAGVKKELIVAYHQCLPQLDLYSYKIYDGGTPSTESRGNKNGFIEQGEIIGFWVNFENTGELYAQDVTVELSTEKNGVIINKGKTELGRIDAGKTSKQARFLFTVQRTTMIGNLPLKLVLKEQVFPLKEKLVNLEILGEGIADIQVARVLPKVGDNIWVGTKLEDAGMIWDLLRDPANPEIIYLATEKSGVLKSENGGLDWKTS